ncbi:hypothetical protein [Deinococcus sp. UYEF24]
MTSPVFRVLSAGPGIVLGGSFTSVLIDGQPTMVTKELWLDNFSSERALLHYVSLSWSGDSSVPVIEEWPYMLVTSGKGQPLLNSERYFDLALKAREQHGASFGLLLQRAVGLTLTAKVVTAQGPAFLTTGLWVPKQNRPEYFQVTS